MTSSDARRVLVRILQDAHAGELAAAYAYRGHWRSITGDLLVRAEIRRIEEAEWHHRSVVRRLLEELGARPRRGRELVMALVGRFFGLLCHIGGRFGPMFAAGRLEGQNVGQYADARDCAEALAHRSMSASLRAMEQEEVRHEDFFSDQCRGHWLVPPLRWLTGWGPRPATGGEGRPVGLPRGAGAHRVI